MIAGMGAQGIRRRKKRRRLPDVPDLPPGDVGRLFGRFTWSAYSPAGNLERHGFFWRQWSRARPSDATRAFRDAMRSTLIVTLTACAIVVGAVVVWKVVF